VIVVVLLLVHFTAFMWTVVHCSSEFRNWWLVAHLTDLLHHQGILEPQIHKYVCVFCIIIIIIIIIINRHFKMHK